MKLNGRAQRRNSVLSGRYRLTESQQGNGIVNKIDAICKALPTGRKVGGRTWNVNAKDMKNIAQALSWLMDEIEGMGAPFMEIAGLNPADVTDMTTAAYNLSSSLTNVAKKIDA